MYVGGHAKERKQRGKTLHNGGSRYIRTWKDKRKTGILIDDVQKVLVLIVRGPLKSMFILSNGWVAFYEMSSFWSVELWFTLTVDRTGAYRFLDFL